MPLPRKKLFNKKNKSLALIASIVPIVFILSYVSSKVPCAIGLRSCEENKIKEVVKNKGDILLDKIYEGLGKTYLTIKNFDKRSMTAYINGIKKDPDLLGRIQVDSKTTSFLRIESPHKQHFVKKIVPNEQETISINIPNMPEKNFSYLISSNHCQIRGKIFFELYGEKRSERVPIKRLLGIAFPTYGDRRRLAQNGKYTYTLYFQESQKRLRKKIDLKFDRIGQRRDFCDLVK